MTEAAQSEAEKAILAEITADPCSTTALLLAVGSSTEMSVASLQRVFYKMMSDGDVELGPGFVPRIPAT